MNEQYWTGIRASTCCIKLRMNINFVSNNCDAKLIETMKLQILCALVTALLVSNSANGESTIKSWVSIRAGKGE